MNPLINIDCREDKSVIILPSDESKRQSRHIQVFSDDCETCKEHIMNVEIGKCAGCKLEVFLLDNSRDVKVKIERYKIKVHPTTIIDDEIKVEGMPSFYWQCGGSFYDNLKTKYPLKL